MFGRLLPRSESFFTFFQQHAALTTRGAKEFLSFARDGGAVAETARRIKEIEREADTVVHRCMEALHKTFITPFDRNDIHRLVSALDDIIDLIDEATMRLLLYEIEQIRDEVPQMAQVLVQAAETVERAVNGLHDMKHADLVLKECIAINKLENQGDEIHARAIARLFREEKDDPVSIIKWREILESLEDAMDACERVATIVEGVVLEQL